jgi:hypothetical protein
MAEVFEGGCVCGTVRYRFSDPWPDAGICHCQTCRRAAGAPSVAWVTAPAARFAWTAGDPARYASSRGVTRTHCALCGTSLTYQANTESIDVTIASLDDPEAIRPVQETWLSHRLTWMAIDPGRRAAPESG